MQLVAVQPNVVKLHVCSVQQKIACSATSCVLRRQKIASVSTSCAQVWTPVDSSLSFIDHAAV